MKIAIIGQDGAGKTTFLSMLARHIANRRDPLEIIPENLATGKYVAKAWDRLDRAEWPVPTPEGNFERLAWKIKRDAQHLHDLVLLDYAGQDMRDILLEETPGELSGVRKELREYIEQSDLLIYLLDMESFVGCASMVLANENLWMFKTFLTRDNWKNKHRLLVLTKADLYAAMIAESNGDLWSMIEQHRPRIFGLAAFSKETAKIKCFPVTSVRETISLGQSGEPTGKPRLPLESEGFEELVEEILRVGREVENGGLFGWFRNLFGQGSRLLALLCLMNFSAPPSPRLVALAHYGDEGIAAPIPARTIASAPSPIAL
jgi:GTPase SAR1 family protein